MKKLYLLLLVVTLCLTGCQTVSTKQGKSYDYTVVSREDIPEELKEQIETHKMNPFQLSMTDGEYLYIIVGYGEQKTGGYSIQVEGLYEKGEDLCFSTSLIGPEEGKIVAGKKSYPYIVVKTEIIEKNIVYE